MPITFTRAERDERTNSLVAAIAAGLRDFGECSRQELLLAGFTPAELDLFGEEAFALAEKTILQERSAA